MKLKIYNEWWNIKLVTQEYLQNIKKQDDGIHYGLCDETISTIFIYKNLDNQRKRSVLIHEISHAIFGMNQLDNVDVSEEYIVSFVSAHYDEIGKVVKQYFKEDNNE